MGGLGGAGGAGAIAGTGDAGSPTPTPGYTGCSKGGGGVDRIGVTKLISASGLCFDVIIWRTTHDADPGVTLPKDWTLMSAGARACTGSDPATLATSVTGKIEWAPQIGFALPLTVHVDLELVFAANDAGVPASERLLGQYVGIDAACPR